MSKKPSSSRNMPFGKAEQVKTKPSADYKNTTANDVSHKQIAEIVGLQTPPKKK